MSVNTYVSNKRAAGSRNDLPTFDSLAACSGATGIPKSHLSKWKRAGCPAFVGGRVELKALLAWMFTSGDVDLSSEDWNSRLRKAQAERQELLLAKERRQVVSRDFIADGLGAGMAMLFGELDRAFCSELPAVVKGLDEIQIRARSVEAIAQLKAAFADKLGKLMAGEEPNE